MVARRSGQSGFVKPFVWAGEGYQGQYPLLVSDRYLIVDAALKRAAELGTACHCARLHRHGQRPGALRPGGQGAPATTEIIAPIREIQKEHTQVRAYEQA
ncbi:MAG: hypothetical protein LKM39_01160 [Chiayiivirga sp.]|jgi:argininosuccinate synthase|nr:hypothetical protein [Chiayiivirga sp.]